MFSTSGTTGVSGSSPGKRDVQYLVVLLNSASKPHAYDLRAAYPRTSGSVGEGARGEPMVGVAMSNEDARDRLPKLFAHAAIRSASRRSIGRR